MQIETEPVTLKEGWHVLHQIYSLDEIAWSSQKETPDTSLSNLKKLICNYKAQTECQLLLYSIIGQADLGFLAISPDAHQIDQFEKQFHKSLGSGTLNREYSFLSLTEESEYTTTSEEFAERTAKEEGIAIDSPEMTQRVAKFEEMMKKFRNGRVYPQFEDWKTLCFYPMSKRREPEQNWYALPYEERRRLMGGHARVGRSYAGRVKQIITGSTGLGDWEWGVTLFSNSIDEFKKIIYEMRFDEVTHQYADFGPFYIGLLMEFDELIDRLQLR